jgi:hypothetical protein
MFLDAEAETTRATMRHLVMSFCTVYEFKESIGSVLYQPFNGKLPTKPILP